MHEYQRAADAQRREMNADLERALAIIEHRAEAIENGAPYGGPTQEVRDIVAASLRGAAAAIRREVGGER